MKKRRLYLHIGTEKTGTTSIQEMLVLNRDLLAEQGYHSIRSAGEGNNRKLSAYAMREDDFDDFHQANGIETPEERQRFERGFASDLMDELESLPNHIHSLIASSEHLHSRCIHHEDLCKLRNLLNPFCNDIRILVYLRPQLEVITSLYSTWLKCGGFDAFEDFVIGRCTPDSPYFDYQRLLALWADVFGASQLIVRLYQRDELLERDLLKDFAAAIGIQSARNRLEAPASLNESISAVGQACFRALNERKSIMTIGPGNRHVFERLSQFMCDKLPGPGMRLDPGLAERIQRSFADSNEAVRSRWFPERDILFGTAASDAVEGSDKADPTYLTLFDEMLTIMLQLSDKVDQANNSRQSDSLPSGSQENRPVIGAEDEDEKAPQSSR